MPFSPQRGAFLAAGFTSAGSAGCRNYWDLSVKLTAVVPNPLLTMFHAKSCFVDIVVFVGIDETDAFDDMGWDFFDIGLVFPG